MAVELPGPWSLSDASSEQLAVLGACWAVPVEQLADSDRVWVQSQGAGDAPGPRMVTLASRSLVVLPAPGEVSPRWTSRMVGLRGFIELPDRAVPLPEGLSVLSADSAPAVAALHARADPGDLVAASPSVEDAELAVGVFVDGQLAGIAAAVPTPVGPPEVSVLVDPAHRRRGLAVILERALVGALGGGPHRWLQHRTVITDVASQILAARCGFALLSIEHLVRPAV